MLGRTKRIHFVGIGGIGMSSIAELLHNQGLTISGSDMKKSEITQHLEDIGITVVEGHAPENIGEVDVVVRSSAVKDDNLEIITAKQLRIPVIRRAEMLAEITRMSFSIGIAGTHGKTTTTSMVGIMLEKAKLDPTIIVGGKVKNFGSNNLMGSGKYIVVEADEYDHSFLTLTPIIAGITNIDADHLDCYRNLDDIKSAFLTYAEKVPFFGTVIACLDDKGVQAVLPKITKNIVTYGFSKQADVRGENIEMVDFTSSFDLIYKNYKMGRIKLQVTGKHNILNSLLACSVGLELDIPFTSIQEGLYEYKGVYRRFENKGTYQGVSFFDDYAHHPTEIMATLDGFRDSTNRRVVVLFQPHLFSRTRDFSKEFGRAFFSCDKLFIAPIYPARELPIPGITGELIVDEARRSGHKNVTYIENEDDIVETILEALDEDDIFITMGAGRVYKFGEKVIARLSEG